MEKSRSLSIAVRGLFVSAFLSTIFGVANASAYTVTYNANGAVFDTGEETNIVVYNDDHSVASGEYKLPDMHNPDTYEMYWSLEQNGKTEAVVEEINSDTTLYAQYLHIRWDFDYTGSEFSFSAPMDRRYILEAWGASGGGFVWHETNRDPENPGGYGGTGGFSIGAINLLRDSSLYINVGGTTDNITGGYNGGGNGRIGSQLGKGGGGATHIATVSGLLKELEDKQSNILIVAGGGGASGYPNSRGGSSGGGVQGVVGPDFYMHGNYDTASGLWYGGHPGSQTNGGPGKGSNMSTAGTFGQGGDSIISSTGGNGGGGGFYGGGGSNRGHGGGGGGSGYIANTNLIDKYMVVDFRDAPDVAYTPSKTGGYILESNDEETRTYATRTLGTTSSTDAQINYAKEGNGYASIEHKNIRIKYIFDENRVENYLYDYANTEEYYTTLSNLSMPEKAGYSAHWYANGSEWDFNTKVNEDITLEATYLPITYNLTYDLGTGTLSETNPATYTIESDDIALNNPTAPDYYDFLGWSGTGLTGNTNLTVTIPKGSIGDRDYTANYTPIPYTITYNLDGGTNGTNNPTEYNYESNEIVLARPTKEGYTFLGWSGTGIDGEGNLDVTIPAQSHGDREYTAHWSINQYTATFDVNGGAAIDPTTITSDYNVAFGNLPETSRTGYDFDGWFTEQTGGTKISDATTMPAEDHTYYAHWTIQTFNITYDLNGGELAQGASNPDTYTYESADINLAKPSREGYTFLGWSGTDLADNTEDVTIAHNSLGDRSYKAEFQINEYTATFDANAGETANPETITKNYDEELGNLPETSRLGYTFLGWFTDATNGDEITSATKMPAGDVTYYAHWEIIAYTIEYDLGGEDMDSAPTNDASNPTSYTVEDADITLKAATPGDTWHYFVGWALDRDSEDGLSDNFVIDTAEAKNIKVYAIFQANPYTVTLDPGNGDDEIVKTVRGDQEIGELPTPERAGYEFLGWFVGDKQIDEHFHPRSDSIAVARWEEIPTVPDTGANSTPNTGDAIMNHIVTFAVCALALFIVVVLRKHKAKNEA